MCSTAHHGTGPTAHHGTGRGSIRSINHSLSSVDSAPVNCAGAAAAELIVAPLSILLLLLFLRTAEPQTFRLKSLATVGHGGVPASMHSTSGLP